MNITKIKCLIFGALLIGNVFAVDVSTTVNIPLTIEQINEQKSGAKYWGITRSEYVLALELKKQYKGLVSEDITPLEYLGVFAKTEQDKNKYARLFIEKDRAVIQNILDFDKTIQKVNYDLYGFDEIIKYQRKPLPRKRIKMTININDCNDICEQRVRRLELGSSLRVPVDFYFVSATNEQINIFAHRLGIKADKVNKGITTLNHAQ